MTSIANEVHQGDDEGELAKLLEKAQMTKGELVEALGLEQSSIARAENNEDGITDFLLQDALEIERLSFALGRQLRLSDEAGLTHELASEHALLHAREVLDEVGALPDFRELSQSGALRREAKQKEFDTINADFFRRLHHLDFLSLGRQGAGFGVTVNYLPPSHRDEEFRFGLSVQRAIRGISIVKREDDPRNAANEQIGAIKREQRDLERSVSPGDKKLAGPSPEAELRRLRAEVRDIFERSLGASKLPIELLFDVKKIEETESQNRKISVHQLTVWLRPVF